jgi:hypothetical protein
MAIPERVQIYRIAGHVVRSIPGAGFPAQHQRCPAPRRCSRAERQLSDRRRRQREARDLRAALAHGVGDPQAPEVGTERHAQARASDSSRSRLANKRSPRGVHRASSWSESSATWSSRPPAPVARALRHGRGLGSPRYSGRGSARSSPTLRPRGARGPAAAPCQTRPLRHPPPEAAGDPAARPGPPLTRSVEVRPTPRSRR